jgi:spore coat polysaccharide biosynthesis predicted glycosyltransferase SpsG
MAISTFGISTYELMYLGIPVISVSHAQINAEGSYMLAKRYNAHIDLGLIDSLSKESLEHAILQLTSKPALREYYSNIGKKLVDGKGVERVASIILNH